MKRFIKKCIIFILILSVLFLPLGVGLDPYNIFHWNHIRNNGVEPNKSYVKMMNILNNKDKFDSFLFGSSRAGFFDVSKMNDGKYYDMAYSEGLPGEHLQNIKDLLDRGVKIKNITMGVDDISYFVDPDFHSDQLYRKAFPWDGSLSDKAGFYLSYLDLVTLSQSIEVIMKHKNTDPGYGARLLETGTENLSIEPDFHYDKLDPTWSDYYYPREESLDEIGEIVEICRENGIKLRVFTNPVNGYTYAKDIANGYIPFLKKLAKVTPYWNFSGFNNVTLDMSNYYETSHFSPEVADQIIDRIYNDKGDPELLEQGYGMYVTEENVEELMDILYGQAVNFDLPTDNYPDTLNKEDEENKEE